LEIVNDGGKSSLPAHVYCRTRLSSPNNQREPYAANADSVKTAPRIMPAWAIRMPPTEVRLRLSLPYATAPQAMAANVPMIVNAPTSASSKLKIARPLLLVDGGDGGSAKSGLLQSGQAIVWPANLSSISNLAPQEQVRGIGMMDNG
jgi:hypothetical protein